MQLALVTSRRGNLERSKGDQSKDYKDASHA